MKKPEIIPVKKELIHTGDIFFIENHTALGNFINWGQRILSSDNHARYNHSGIFKTGYIEGTEVGPSTIESLWTVQSNDFFQKYKGKQVLIARPVAPTEDKEEAVSIIVNEDSGKKYPGYRFFYLIYPPIAKYINRGASVCSELTAKYLFLAGVRHKWYQGTTPDKLVDEVRNYTSRYYIIGEGVI